MTHDRWFIKRISALLLACVLLLTSCASPSKNTANQNQEIPALSRETISSGTGNAEESAIEESYTENVDESAVESVPEIWEEPESAISPSELPEELDAGRKFSELTEDSIIEERDTEDFTFDALNDPELLEYTENSIYSDLTEQLDLSDYHIDNVSAVYISKEYLEERAYNSQSNIFFGYSLDELDAQFQGKRYIFTLDEDDVTTVVPFTAYDDNYEQVIEQAFQNVAIGTGIILISVTVSVISGGVGIPAVSMISASSAKTAAIYAASSGIMSGVMAGIFNGVQTGDFQEALKAGILAGSKDFKWGAIVGVVHGGQEELVALKNAAQGGLTLNQAAKILQESDYPANIVKNIRRPEEYEIYRENGLFPNTISDKPALIRQIDLNYKSELSGKIVTNLERALMGYSPLEPATNLPYELHHIGQEINSPLAILTRSEHMSGGHNAILHNPNIEQGVHRQDPNWAKTVRSFWKSYAEKAMANMLN